MQYSLNVDGAVYDSEKGGAVDFLAWYWNRSGDSEFKGSIEEKLIQFDILEKSRKLI